MNEQTSKQTSKQANERMNEISTPHHNGGRPHLAHRANPYKQNPEQTVHYPNLFSRVGCNCTWDSGKPVVTVAVFLRQLQIVSGS